MTPKRPDITLPLPKHPMRRLPPRPGQPDDLNIPQQLCFVVGAQAHVITTPVRPYLVLGRRDSTLDNDIHLDLAPFNAHALGVSRAHIMILSPGNCLLIKDLNSTNGTLLNGYHLEPHQEVILRHNDELTLGRLWVQVRFINPAAR